MAELIQVVRISGTIQVGMQFRHGTPAMFGTLPIAMTFVGAARKDGIADVRGTIPIAVTFTGDADITSVGQGDTSFTPWTTLGSNYAYSDGDGVLPYWTSEGYSGVPEGSYAIGDASFELWSVAAIGLTGGLGQGDVSFKRWDSLGAGRHTASPVYNYSEGSTEFEYWESEGVDELFSGDVAVGEAFAVATYRVSAGSSVTASNAGMAATEVFHGVAASMVVASSLAVATVDLAGVAASIVVVASEALVDGAEQTVWSFNAETFAASRYVNYDFESFAAFGGRHYGANALGIYELDGDDDAGVDITGSAMGPRMSFDSSHLKRMPATYLSGTSEGKLTLRVVGDDGVVRAYSTKAPLGDKVRYRRVDPAKGLQMHYWQVEARNQAGEDFVLDSIDLMPVVLQRRVKK